MSQPANGVASLPVELTNSATSPPASSSEDNIRRWASWTLLLVERLPLPFVLIVLIETLIVGGEQFFEFVTELGTLQHPITDMLVGFARHLVLPILLVYMLLMLKRLKTSTVRSLAELRPSVQINDSEYDNHVYRMVNTNRRVELALLLVSAVGVFFLFDPTGIASNSTTTLNPSPFGLGTILILTPYILFGWVFLTHIFSALQLGNALGKLAQCRLSVNIYDPGNLLPFGHIALIYSLSVAGVILLLLIGLGQPTQPSSWAVITLLLVSGMVALVIPLWGVNQQMRDARHAELERIHEQLRLVHERILNETNLDPAELAQMSSRTSTLVNLRKVVLETPTWPYRDTLMIVRAFAISIAPVLYFVLQLFILNVIASSRPTP